jgi:hypothetical protein
VALTAKLAATWLIGQEYLLCWGRVLKPCSPAAGFETAVDAAALWIVALPRNGAATLQLTAAHSLLASH